MANMDAIRNFVITAHIDHGKSTLADRFLEITGTVDTRKMQAQHLDQLDLERERGITIKMTPVCMTYSHGSHSERSEESRDMNTNNEILHSVQDDRQYILNLIDTPGHSDFSYEVSRALAAVEGAILLVDATQGIQAQTLANLRSAEDAGLTIIGALNKIDMNPPGVDELAVSLAELINCEPKDIYRISAKTGEGVVELLNAVIEKIPAPKKDTEESIARAMIFDSFYDTHKGIIASVRVLGGTFEPFKNAHLIATDTDIKIKELGVFSPKLQEKKALGEGEIGYIATGIKDPEKIKIGDTIIAHHESKSVEMKGLALGGYKEPKPVVFVSFYPEDADEHEALYVALQKLKLNDSALTMEPAKNEVLGRGFKVGFLGRLHFEITAERLKREFDIETVHTFPSVMYRAKTAQGWEEIVNPADLPREYAEIWEPMVQIEVIMPQDQLSGFFRVQSAFRFQDVETETLPSRVVIRALLPLAELVSDFDDQLKSATQGYASFTYEVADYQKSDIVGVDLLVAGDVLPGMSRFFHKSSYEREARKMTERLKKLLPRQQFPQAIQAQAQGRIIAREDIPAMKKNVTGHLYGGDYTRKMKLWQKQKKGKKKLKERAQVQISGEVFRELLKK